MSKYYVGITIGPIMETLFMANRPASLWCASAMFSWLSEDLCNKALDLKETVNIISPYYPEKNNLSEYSVVSEGIGKYHDRIIFSIESNDEIKILNDNIKNMIYESKTSLAKELTANEEEQEHIINYLTVRYIIEENDKVEKNESYEKNCILRLSPYLDAVELCAEFEVDQTFNPLKKLFEGETQEEHNKLLKDVFKLKDHKQLISDGKIKDIESIANNNSESDKKIYNYYAIVQADGDSIGEYLRRLTNDDDVQKFSEQCLKYTSNAAKLVNGFGGVTIYAGGDDLLFISPLTGNDVVLKNGEAETKPDKRITLFELCDRIRKEFVFSKDGDGPTLSYGITICFKKYPLYEALKNTLKMLFKVSKNTEDQKDQEDNKNIKNRTSLTLQKHSGQSVQLRYINGSIIYDKLIDLIPGNEISSQVMHSILFKLDLYKPIIKAALNANIGLKDTFNNLFDSSYHDKVRDYINKIQDTLKSIYEYNKHNEHSKEDFKIYLEKDKRKIEDRAETSIDLLTYMLRIAKFYSEKKGEK